MQIPDFPHGKDHFIHREWIINAIDCGSLASVQWMLSKNVNLHFIDDEGYSVLHTCIERDNADKYEILQLLIDSGADVNVGNNLASMAINSWTPLHLAAARNDIDAIKILLENGADISLKTIIDNYCNAEEEATILGQKEAADFIRNYHTKKKLNKTIFSVLISFLAGALLMFSCRDRKGELIDSDKSSFYYYSKDKQKLIYDNGEYSWQEDYHSFKCDFNSLIIMNGIFAKDKNHVYFKGAYSQNADAATFEILNDHYLKDAYHVYKRPDIDKENFIFDIVDSANPRTFKELDYGWYKDDKHYFRENRIVPDVDSTTFETIDWIFAKDKLYLYIESAGWIYKIRTDTRHLEVLEKGKAISDGEFVYKKEYLNNDPTNMTIINKYTIDEYYNKYKSN
jgi:hypothetical protein